MAWGLLPAGTPGGEDMVYRAVGFTGPQRLEVAGRVVERTADQVVSSVYSLSSSAPHLFGEQLEEFDRKLDACSPKAARKASSVNRCAPSRSTSGADACW